MLHTDLRFLLASKSKVNRFRSVRIQNLGRPPNADTSISIITAKFGAYTGYGRPCTDVKISDVSDRAEFSRSPEVGRTGLHFRCCSDSRVKSPARAYIHFELFSLLTVCSSMGELYGRRSTAKRTDGGHSVDLETSFRATLYLCTKCMKFSILHSFTVDPPLPLFFLSRT
jgi:hypothetical protein